MTFRKHHTLAWLASAFAVLAVLVLAGCGSSAPASSGSGSAATSGSSSSESATTVRVGSLKGPTSIGIASFMDKAAGGGTKNSYNFTIGTSADEIVPSLTKGDLDIALVPANVASVVYNKTKGAVSVIDINTLGVLSIVTGDSTLTDFSNLAGKTVYMTGKGATPEYAMDYLLDKAGIKDKVTLEFKSEPTEVVSALTNDPNAVGVLPQPYVTAATTKNQSLKATIDLNDVWAKYADKGSQLVTGVTVVRNDFLKKHPGAVAEFLSEQEASVKAANDDPASTAKLVVNAGILDNEQIAAKAIPQCHLVCIEGSEMKDALSGYLSVLNSEDPSSIGGALPSDDFYYEAK